MNWIEPAAVQFPKANASNPPTQHQSPEKEPKPGQGTFLLVVGVVDLKPASIRDTRDELAISAMTSIYQYNRNGMTTNAPAGAPTAAGTKASSSVRGRTESPGIRNKYSRVTPSGRDG